MTFSDRSHSVTQDRGAVVFGVGVAAGSYSPLVASISDTAPVQKLKVQSLRSVQNVQLGLTAFGRLGAIGGTGQVGKDEGE